MTGVDLAASVIGIISAGTKVSLVLLQLASDVESASSEARMISTEIKAFVVVIDALVEHLQSIQHFDQYEEDGKVKEMIDACLGMFTDLQNAVEEVLVMVRRKDGEIAVGFVAETEDEESKAGH